MATVVHVPQDTRTQELGFGVAKFLNRMKETRLDKAQQDLMDRISKAPDEATAAALLADPAYQDVVSDPNRFALIDRHLTNAQPGQQTLQGYNEAGEQEFFSVRKGTPIDNSLWEQRGLHVSPEVPFYVTDPMDPESLPTMLGQFRNRADAAAEAADRFGVAETNIFNRAEAELEMRRATQLGQSRRAEENLDVTKERLELAKTNPQSALGQVMEDWREGQFGEPSSPAAILLRDRMIERMVSIVGRTPSDVTDDTKQDLLAQGAAVKNLTRRAGDFISQVEADPRILSKIGALDRFAENVSAELRAAAQFSGIRRLDLDTYDFQGFAAQSTTFKNMLVDFAVAYAASKGIKGRDLSNQEFQKFLSIVGSDISNPVAFIQNMSTLVNNVQQDFLTTWDHLQVLPSGGAVPAYEDTYGSFTKFDTEQKDIRNTIIKSLQERYPELELELPSDMQGGT